MEEYLRRNQLHAAAVGLTANARSALARLRKHRRPPRWLIDALAGIVDRGRRVTPEMALHRDELSPYGTL